jgi:hypothetical protein
LPLVGANERGHRLCGLSFVGNQWIVVHGLYGLGVARKSLVRQVEHMCVWRNVAQPLENREGEIGRRQLMSETFADQTRQLTLMVQRV